MNTQRLTCFGTLLLLPIAFASGASADPAVTPAAPAAAPVDTTPAKIDPKALALMDEVDKKRKNMRGMTADFAVTLKLHSAQETGYSEGSLQYLRPNYVRVDAWQLKKDETSGKLTRDGDPRTVASDGKNGYVVSSSGDARTVDVDPAQRALDTGYDPGDRFFDMDHSLRKRIDTGQQMHVLVSLTYAGQQDWEGQTYDVVDEVEKQGTRGMLRMTNHLYIGPDKVIHRSVREIGGQQIGEWDLRNVNVSPKLSAKNFAYTLPATAHLPEPAAAPAPPALLANGSVAPDFLATTPDGKQVHLSDYKGKPVILDFWATWCGPCQASMPHLNGVYKTVKDKDVVVLAVCVWDDKDSYAKWVIDKKATYDFPTMFDPAGKSGKSIAGDLYKVSGIPTQFVIDKDGKIAASNVGYGGEDDHRLEDELTKLGVDVPAPAGAKS